ncbi:MAG: DUF4381 family protein [Gammaproteobacteria bacterium]|nr:DUF4381 family protein [Gammaproteobacteria bacterium]MBU1724771.1 DUF4381 family protein [Gammaproteobacteria bacterium]MBU2005778.1 DUF4381 family protein [Gammaproteobacteria bacterium]
MNQTLHDLELPPAPLPDYLWWLLALAALLLLGSGLWLWRKRQQPAAKALRKLAKLPDDPANLPQLAAIVRGVEGSGGFLSRLDHARFAPTPCTPEAFATLKHAARTLLEQAR